MPTTFINTINGNEILAKRGQCDYAGQDIQTTYATKSEVTTGLTSKEDSANKAQTLIPSSTTNFPSSAATANFVNSSVATATANFLGNFTLTDLGLTYPATDTQIGAALDSHVWPAGVTPTNNDYTYIEIQDPQTTGIDDSVERFKFNGTNWAYEYTLNNSSFTAAEKSAIDSGIDSAKVAVYDAHVANSDIHVTLSDKSTWNAKQDAISDLATIRSGAAAGATAIQPGDLPTVDQTYNASSTNAQSGVAVAQAIAAAPAASYTAGDGIDISAQDEISVDYDPDTLKINSSSSTVYSVNAFNGESGDMYAVIADGALADVIQDPTKSFTLHIPGNTFSTWTPMSSGDKIRLIMMNSSRQLTGFYSAAELSYTTSHYGQTYIAEQDVTVTGFGPDWSGNGGSFVTFYPYAFKFGISNEYGVLVGGNVEPSSEILSNPVTFTYSTGSGSTGLAVKNPLPASTVSDANKVLSVNAQGNPAWATAGNMLSVSNNVLNVTTTAGITDVQMVNARPAQTVSTVLYRIPET